MIKRHILNKLLVWKDSKWKKPLIIRGARQIGKTFIIKQFGEKYFDNFIYLNLEKPSNAKLFNQNLDLSTIIELIELQQQSKLTPGKTLLFIDEIQTSREAMTQLRYFYEDYPGLHVIAAGSLLEVKMTQEGFSFPVGRIEYAYMFPVTYAEYVETIAPDFFKKLLSIEKPSDISSVLHQIFLKQYYEYISLGGMPEAIERFIQSKSYFDVNKIYDSIFQGFLDDVHKYSTNAKGKYIQFVLTHAPESSGKLIKYEKFGNSHYKSREIKDAVTVLEKAMILDNIKASSSLQIPISVNNRKSKKLIFLDAGLMNYRLGLREELLQMHDLNDCYRGQLAEQVVGQTLLTLFSKDKIAYWYRDVKGASSEIDFIIQHKGSIIAIEVKSGKKGRLRSLQIFMNESKQRIAFRIYSGAYKVENVEYLDKSGHYKLISLPFYLLFRIKDFA